MVGWHHQLNGHGFKQTQGDSERQGSLACCKFMAFQRVGRDLVAEQQQLICPCSIPQLNYIQGDNVISNLLLLEE